MVSVLLSFLLVLQIFSLLQEYWLYKKQVTIEASKQVTIDASKQVTIEASKQVI